MAATRKNQMGLTRQRSLEATAHAVRITMRRLAKTFHQQNLQKCGRLVNRSGQERTAWSESPIQQGQSGEAAIPAAFFGNNLPSLLAFAADGNPD